MVILEQLPDRNYSHLNRRRYAQNDETLYVAPEDDRTDYVRASALEQSQLLNLSSCSRSPR